MALTLAVTDLADGTGATATVAGADGDTSVTVYVSPVSTGTSPIVWTSAGSRTGDGTLTLGVEPAYYYAHALGTVSGAAAVSVPVIFLASRGTEAVYTLVKNGIQARIQGLTLTGLSRPPGDLPAERVYVFTKHDWRHFSAITEALPAVIISPPPKGAESTPGLLTGKDDIGYPVQVTLIDRATPLEAIARTPTYDLWRQQMFRALRNQRLDTAPTVITLAPEPGPIADWDNEAKPALGIFQSSIVFRAISREPRGV